MENKQIIIDNIDVSGCNFTLERDGKIKCECTHATGFGVICDCEKWHNCYFKQLEQVKQENKRLLEIINAKSLETVDIDSAFEIEKLKERLQTKEQECEGLKKCLLQVQNASISLNKQLYQLKAENDLYKNAHKTEQDRRRSYENALTEIKEIAEFLAPMTDEYEDCYDRDRCFECEFTDICKYFNIKQILQKISEVI